MPLFIIGVSGKHFTIDDLDAGRRRLVSPAGREHLASMGYHEGSSIDIRAVADLEARGFLYEALPLIGIASDFETSGDRSSAGVILPTRSSTEPATLTASRSPFRTPRDTPVRASTAVAPPGHSGRSAILMAAPSHFLGPLRIATVADVIRCIFTFPISSAAAVFASFVTYSVLESIRRIALSMLDFQVEFGLMRRPVDTVGVPPLVIAAGLGGYVFVATASRVAAHHKLAVAKAYFGIVFTLLMLEVFSAVSFMSRSPERGIDSIFATLAALAAVGIGAASALGKVSETPYGVRA